MGATSALLEFLRPKRPAVQDMTPDAFMGEQSPSMVFVARFSLLPESSKELDSAPSFNAAIDELGFGRSWSSRLSSEPPRDSRFDTSYTDRFLFVQSGKSQGRSLASVAIDEATVYDWQLRSDIDFTGFRVSVTLREDAFRPLLKYIGAQASWEESRAPVFAVHLPSEPFAFPELRGSPAPFAGGNNYTKKLNPIRRFKVDEFSAAIVDYKTPYIKWSPGMALHERYHVLSAWKFFLA